MKILKEVLMVILFCVALGLLASGIGLLISYGSVLSLVLITLGSILWGSYFVIKYFLVKPQ